MKKSMKRFFILCCLTLPLSAGPYAPAANKEGTEAVSLDDSRISHWATQVTRYVAGEEVDERWQDTGNALGEAEGNAFDVTSLGRGGEIVLEFDPPIQNLAGNDFGVFENAFSHSFLELAFIEISNDGIHFTRFENDSLTVSPVSAIGSVEACQVTGLAGKYLGGKGTPFDLDDLGFSSVRYVRVVDVIGGMSFDTSGDIIYDPWPTQGSAGFDLDGIAVLNSVEPPVSILSWEVDGDDLVIQWQADVGVKYIIESSGTLLNDWKPVMERTATETSETLRFLKESEWQFFRIRRKLPMN